MIEWLKNLFHRDPPKLKVEVTIHVPTINVFTHGSTEEKKESNIAESGSGTSVEQEGPILRNAPPITDQERITSLGQRLQNIHTPEVDFGKEHK